ncbi:hypothetical protein GW17_00042963 [Ensete ventricosum]|nr:hypothetical protein GW17_00042963 [Ensete ventricosum]
MLVHLPKYITASCIMWNIFHLRSFVLHHQNMIDLRSWILQEKSLFMEILGALRCGCDLKLRRLVQLRCCILPAPCTISMQALVSACVRERAKSQYVSKKKKKKKKKKEETVRWR